MKKPSLVNTLITVGISIIISAVTYEYKKMIDANKEFVECAHDDVKCGDTNVQ